MTAEDCLADDPLYMHGVTWCEEMKVPLLLYAATGKQTYLRQAENALRKLVRDHLLPDGCPSSVEQTRGNSVCWGHETCVVSDFTWSLGYFLAVTGKAEYADLLERCVFNAGFGSITKDFKALQYFSNVNQFRATADSNPNPYRKGGTRTQYRSTHPTECCAGNVNRFLPNYVSRMWLKDSNGDPVAALYGPSEVDYGFVKIREETNYPFDGKIRFRFALSEPRAFGFTYRVPDWCVDDSRHGRFVRVEKTFTDGETLELDFKMTPRFVDVDARHYVVRDLTLPKPMKLPGPERKQGVVVMRGPLLYAYPIPERRVRDDVDHPELRGKKSGNPDFCSWDLFADAPYNYALAARAVESAAAVSVLGLFEGCSLPSLRVPVRRIRWNLAEGRYTPDMPVSVEYETETQEMVELLPYGATCLRLAVFPES